MSEVKFSAKAFCKIILHAAKYPHCAINGVLLAKPNAGSREIEFVDAVPLFHISLHLTPMSEIALMQVDELASKMGLVIAGYYAASENIRDNTFEKTYHKVAEKIASNYSPSYVVVVNNSKVSTEADSSSLKVAQLSEGGFRQIEEQNISLSPAQATSYAIVALMQQKAFQKLIDFDNHLDNICADWMNVELNKTIESYL
ncbi:ER membrane protein complex subunit 8/9 homolog [Dendroctonus ponderosae]